MRRYAKAQFQCIGHDGRFQRKENEGKRGVDQRGNGGADITKAGATGKQVHIHAIAGGVQADRQASQKNNEAGGQDGPEGIKKTGLHHHGGAHGLQHQKRRGTAHGGIGHPPRRPAAKTLRGKAQRVVLQRFAGHPAVVVSPDSHHGLW